MEHPVAWKDYDAAALAELEGLCADYVDFISDNKTERECVRDARRRAEEAGYRELGALVAKGEALKPGDKVYATHQGKAILLVQLGAEPLVEGMNILGAHIDSPRLDLKQNPAFEAAGFAYLDTHYYGGIKNYQWVATPLALHGAVTRTDGTTVDVVVGEDPADPVFCVTDLLPHLGREQMAKKASEVVAGEDLDLLVGNRPLVIEREDGSDDAAAGSTGADAASKDSDADKDPVKAMLLDVLAERYGMEEADFLSAELEVVPAGRARELGFDRSMVIGYGQDDRVCAYTSLVAQLAVDAPTRTSATILVDKEEIGSVGASGMMSNFFENAVAEILELSGEGGHLKLRRCLNASAMLSSDVSAAFDPAYASVFETKNSAYAGRGLVINKYTGSRGKAGSNDARAEYVGELRRVFAEGKVRFQTAELGRVDAGGGGTIAYIPAKYGMDVIDSGVAVLSMHSPWEVTSKADIFEAYKGYVAFLTHNRRVPSDN